MPCFPKRNGYNKQNAIATSKVNLLKSEFVAGRLIDAYLFGEHHPYGKYNNAEDYDAIVAGRCKGIL